MALTNGIETVAFVTMGYYTDEYTAADNIADLFCSWGLLEDVLEQASGGGTQMGISIRMK